MPWSLYLFVVLMLYMIGTGCVLVLPMIYGVYVPRPLVRFFSPLWRLIAPQTERCTRCNQPFELVKSHTTSLGEGYQPITALCQHDWKQLNPENRMPHYERMMDLDQIDPASKRAFLVTQAVRAGK